MGRIEELDARIHERMDAMNKRLADRMAALDARLGYGGGGSILRKADSGEWRALDRDFKAGERSLVRRGAVCVGLRKVAYNNSLAELPGCPIDADRFACLLENLKFPKGSVAVLKDETATCNAVYDAISAAADAFKAGDLFVLLISGHGGKESWSLYDGRATRGEIVWALSKFRKGVRILIVNDQCHSGAFFAANKTKEDSLFKELCRKDGCDDSWDPLVAWQSPDFPPMVMQFASCRAEQNSSDGLAGGSWTQALIDTLLQKLCVEKIQCSYREWFDAAKASPFLNHGEQDPECVESPNMADSFRHLPWNDLRYDQ